ncbi:MAG: hypothetical protein IPJ01_11905 [Micavibrio sp.]|nr:hypothetical protein [Micavibrio sp.]
MEKKTKNILLIGGAILGTALLYLAYKKYKGEKKSNLVDEMLENFGKPISQFTLTNNTSTPQSIILFDAFNNINPSSSPIIVSPSMSFFNNTLLSEPKKIKRIQIRVNSGSFAQAQATQLITKTCKDASGNSATENYMPMISTTQYQGGMTEIEPDDLVLDGTCTLNYTVQPNTTVTLIFDYKTDRKFKRKGMFADA